MNTTKEREQRSKGALEQRSTSKGAHPKEHIPSQTVRTTTSICVQPQKFTSSRQISVVRFLGGCCSTCGNLRPLALLAATKTSCSTPPVACLLLYSRQLRPRPTSNSHSHYPIPPSCTPPSCTPPSLPLSPLLPRSLAVAVARSLLLRLAL